MPRPLDVYVRKRNFSRTPEPRGGKLSPSDGEQRRAFVVQ
jgi:hypothetical protein